MFRKSVDRWKETKMRWSIFLADLYTSRNRCDFFIHLNTITPTEINACHHQLIVIRVTTSSTGKYAFDPKLQIHKYPWRAGVMRIDR
jgi:hypothetical protein